MSVRAWSAQQYVAGMFYNQSPVPWRYEADTTRPALNIETNGNESLRLTWQAASKHKITGQYQYGQQDRPFYGYSLGQTLASPEAAYASKSIPSYLGQVGWNSPMTNKILLEAGAAVANKNFFTFLQPMAGNNPSYQESSTGNFWGNSRSTYGQNATWQMNTRASASYVTGSHNAKVGFTVQHQESYTTQEISNNGVLLTLLNGQPRMVTVWATPLLLREINKANVGVFAQDQWTVRNLTLNLGLRYDYFNSYVPEHVVRTGPERADSQRHVCARVRRAQLEEHLATAGRSPTICSEMARPPSSSRPAAIWRRRFSSASRVSPIPRPPSPPTPLERGATSTAITCRRRTNSGL